MKLIRTLHITSQEFYHYLEKELLQDAKKYGHKNVSRVEKGLHFSKYGDDQYARVDVKVLDYVRNQIYSLQMKSYTDTVTVTYKTNETDDGLEIEFEEIISSEKKKKRNKISQKFSETIYLSRMSQTIYDIETAIVKERKEA